MYDQVTAVFMLRCELVNSNCSACLPGAMLHKDMIQ